MQITENHFKKFLVDEIMRTSKNATVKCALSEVDRFYSTEQFNLSFGQWKQLKIKNKICRSGPRHILDIVKNITDAY
jgi:hypothetical protein